MATIKYRNTNERFGDTTTTYAGPIDAIVVEMRPTIRAWAQEQLRDGETIGRAVNRIESEFVYGLVGIEEPEGVKVGPGWTD
jgi:hypothetical protein